MLHAATVSAAGVAIEQPLGRLALDHRVGDLVGVLLVSVALFADPARERNAAALLDDVRRLVRGGVEIGRACERDVIAGRIRLGPHRA